MDKSRVNSEVTHGNLGLELVLKDMIGELAGAYPGNIYVAAQSDTDYYSYLYSQYYKRYEDNSVSIHNTIQAAVDASMDARGDVVLVMPDKWQESVLVFEKSGLKIRAVVPGWETQMRPGDATTKYGCTPVGGSAVGAFAFAVVSRSVEVSGFLCDGGGGHGGIYVGDGYRIDTDYTENAASARIFNNSLRGGNEGVYGVVLDGCSADVQVKNNSFEQSTAAQIYITPGGARTVQRPIIEGNHMMADNGSYGVDMYSSATTKGIIVARNWFYDMVSHAFTYAVRFQGAGVHHTAENHFCCANKISGSSTDFCSGDFYHSAGNAPHFVTDSTNSA